MESMEQIVVIFSHSTIERFDVFSTSFGFCWGLLALAEIDDLGMTEMTIFFRYQFLETRGDSICDILYKNFILSKYATIKWTLSSVDINRMKLYAKTICIHSEIFGNQWKIILIQIDGKLHIRLRLLSLPSMISEIGICARMDCHEFDHSTCLSQAYKLDRNVRIKPMTNVEMSVDKFEKYMSKSLSFNVRIIVCEIYDYKRRFIPKENRHKYVYELPNQPNLIRTKKQMKIEETKLRIHDKEPSRKRRKLNHHNKDHDRREKSETFDSRYHALQKELEEVKVQRDKYKLIASSLKNQILNGTEPRIGLYETCKCPLHGNEWTKNVKLLYDEIGDGKKQKLISEHHQKLSATKRKSIKAFLSLNEAETDYKNPNVLKRNQQILTLNDIVSKEKIKEGHRVPAMIGEFGVFAKMDIPKDLVLGRYIGFECTNKEWNEIFDHTNVDGKNGRYLFAFNVDEKLAENDDGSRSVTIDPIFGNMSEFAGLYINDIRRNIYEPEATDEDKALQNCEFFTFCYKGWPVPIMIATKEIKKGNELLCDYDVGYSTLLKQNARWNKIMQMTSNNIAKNIVQDVNLNDEYQL